jgi:thiamine pyrophosphate-dependent acetolactate synthase large subunit-like protein
MTHRKWLCPVTCFHGHGAAGRQGGKAGLPERQAVCITGDGGFSMVMADFLTAVKNKLPVKVFLFNNRQLGMIMQAKSGGLSELADGPLQCLTLPVTPGIAAGRHQGQ